MISVRHLWLLNYFPYVLFILFWNTVSHTQDKTDTFNLNGYVTYQNGLQASTGFQVKAENQRLKTGWFQQETLTTVETRKDGSYSISFLDIFGSNQTRVGDKIVVQITDSSDTAPPISEVVYIVTSNAIENLEFELNLQLPAELNPKMEKEELETDTFTITGILELSDGKPAGKGYRITGQNLRIREGWFLPPQSETRPDGSFALSFLDIFGSRRTRVGDQINLKAVDNLTDQTVAKTSYYVTPVDIKNLAVKINFPLDDSETVNLPDKSLKLELADQEVIADGLDQTMLTVTIANTGQNLQDNTLSVTAIKGTIGQLTQSETGVYTAVYTSPILSILQPTSDTITVNSSQLDYQTAQNLVLQPVDQKHLETPLIEHERQHILKGISWDINNNQLIDIYDLVPVVQQWGKKKTGLELIGDINQDGIVEATDARLVMDHFGQSTGEPRAVEVTDLKVNFPVSSYLQSSRLNPQVGESLSITIDIHTPLAFAEQISGFEGTLNYDPEKLELIEISMATQFFPAAWYSSNNSEHPTPVPPSKLGQLFRTGSVVFAAAGFPRAKTLSLGKTVAIFKFKALSRCRTRLSISEFKLADQVGHAIPTQISFIDIRPWDLNSDGRVNLEDLSTMRQEWQKNESGLASDLNQDNLVDNFDYQILISNLDNFTQYPPVETTKSAFLTLQPSVTKLPKIGQKITVQVMANSILDLVAYYTTLNYDPAQLQFSSIDLYLEQPNHLGFPSSLANGYSNGKTTGISGDIGWVKPGSITFTKAIMPPISDDRSEKNMAVANLSFIVKNRQDTFLSLSNAMAIDNTNQSLTSGTISLKLQRPVTKNTPVGQIEFLLGNRHFLANGKIITNLEIQLTDQYGSFISGETITLKALAGQISSPATDHGDGTYSADYTAEINQPQTVEILASASNGIIKKLDLHFFHLIELSTPTPQISALPSAEAKIVVTVRNTLGQAQEGQEVNLTADKGQISSPATDNGNGTYTAYYTAKNDQIGSVKITASIPTDDFDVLNLDLIPVRVSPQKSRLKLVGESTLPLSHLTSVEVQLRTIDGLPIVGRDVSLDIEPSNKVRIEESQKTNSEGKTLISFTVGNPGVKVVKAVVDNLTIETGLAFLFTGREQLGDVDLDGEITIFDLVFTASQFGKTGPDLTGDVNQDGQVDVFDLALIAVDLRRSQQPGMAAPVQALDLINHKMSKLSMGEKQRIRLAIQTIKNLETLTADEELVFNVLAPTLQPQETRLLANYPNPFNPETWVPFELAKGGFVQLIIYNASGSIVKQIDCGYMTEGRYLGKNKAIYWDGITEMGNIAPSGVYFYRLVTEDYIQIRKMVLLK